MKDECMETEQEVVNSIIEEPHEICVVETPVWLNILGGISLLVIIFFTILML